MISRMKNLEVWSRYADLGPDFGTPVRPTPLRSPFLAAFNPEVAEMLGLDPAAADDPELVSVFSGAEIPPGARPVAMRYTGHQFGQYNPEIGDGRAILLGEVRGADGRFYDLHLKGAGRTAYARVFDGRAVLRSTIREYLCGEAMHGLGIPTTRSLCIIGSEEPVRRETMESGANLVRVAESHVRFGSFEPHFERNDADAIRTLADWVIADHFPEAADKAGEDRYAAFLGGVVDRTARLVADWQAVGFAHGVMNTDNMSILGLTLDYGPYGFLEAYDPGHICNHSDRMGRYAFNRQPPIALWNLQVLATVLSPILSRERSAEIVAGFVPTFESAWLEKMRRKLGLRESKEEDAELIRDLLNLMAEKGLDYTRFFRDLGNFHSRPAPKHLPHPVDREPDFARWRDAYRERLRAEGGVDAFRKSAMDRVNPKFVLRNYMAEIAIRKATEDRDYSEIERLRRILATPFDEHPDAEEYAGSPPEWGRHLVVSCSS